jgi:precorrin-2 dehydrogenase / sirohydrochlorin ferrochelatase
MSYYPIFADLKDKKTVVVGAGNVGQRKIENLLKHGAKVSVVSREVTSGLSRLMKERKITYLGREFHEEDLNGAFLVIAATDDPSLNHSVSASARKKGILVNAVDQPVDCTFIVPSILMRGDLVIAISTSGRSPALAKRIREDLENRYGLEYQAFLVLLGKLREEVLKKGFSQKENKAIFERIVHSPILEMIRNEEWDRMASLLSEILQQPLSKEGILAYLKAE